MSSLPAHGAGGPFAPCPPPWPSPEGGPRLSSVLSESAWKPWYEPLPASVMAATTVWQQPVRRASHQGRRLNISLLLSLLFHALLLSLTFGGQEFGLPGFALPWRGSESRCLICRVELHRRGAPTRSQPSVSRPVVTAGIDRANGSRRAIGHYIQVSRAASGLAGPASVPRSTPKAKASPKPKAATGAVSASASRSPPKAKASPTRRAATGIAPVNALADGATGRSHFPT